MSSSLISISQFLSRSLFSQKLQSPMLVGEFCVLDQIHTLVIEVSPLGPTLRLVSPIFCHFSPFYLIEM